MRGKTHMLAGMAVATALTPIDSLVGLGVGVVAGVVGALLPDLDAEYSKGASMLGKASTYGILTVAILGGKLLDGRLGVSLLDIVAIAGIVGIVIKGISTGHRQFLHSMEALILLTCCMRLLAGKLACTAFCMGMLSHILLDLLNSKPVTLSYLCKWRKCFYKCKTDGVVAYGLEIASMVVMGILFLSGIWFR